MGSSIGSTLVNDEFKLVGQFYFDSHREEILVGITLLTSDFLLPGSLR